MIRTGTPFAAVVRLLCCGILACSLLTGCGDAPKPVIPAGGSEAAPESSEKERLAAQSADLLKSILAMLKLESLGITAKEDDLVGLINQWQRYSQGSGAQEDEVALEEATLEAWREKLTERQLKQVRRTAFQLTDIERLRNLLLMNAVVRHAVQAGKNDLERVSLAFNTLTRHVELTSAHPEDVPLSPYQIFLLGKGTAADRAWLFAEMLRQLKLETVILSAPLPSGVETWDVNQPFLVGVVIDKDVYLFDTRLGLPLTLPAAPGTPRTIATLAQVRENAEILKQYAVADDKPYGVTSELLKAPSVFVIADTGLWSYRFGRLQQAFTGAHAMVIYEPLIDINGRSGQLTRIAGTPGQPWTAAQVSLWDYPESQLSGQESLTAQHQQTLTRLTDMWKTPVLGEKEKRGDQSVEVAKATNLFLFARLDHAQGKLEDAVKGYTRVRVQLKQRPELQQITERLVYAYLIADEDSLYWTGVCKFDQGTPTDRRVAVDKLQQYLKVYQKGQWIDASHALLAQLAADNGDYATAVTEIQKTSPDHPQHAGFEFFKRNWEQAAAAAPQK